LAFSFHTQFNQHSTTESAEDAAAPPNGLFLQDPEKSRLSLDPKTSFLALGTKK